MFHALCRTILTAALFVVMGAASAAQPANQDAIVIRAATQADLTGVWRQQAVEAPNPNADLSDAWYSGTQFYAFPSPGKMKLLAFAREYEPDAAELAAWSRLPAEWSYSLQPGGGTIISRADGPFNYVQFQTFTADMAMAGLDAASRAKSPLFVPKKGDLLMTYYTSDERVRFMRLLRRVMPTQ